MPRHSPGARTSRSRRDRARAPRHGPGIRATRRRSRMTRRSPVACCNGNSERPHVKRRSILAMTWDFKMRTKHTFRLPPAIASQLADYAARKKRAAGARGGDRACIVSFAGRRRPAGRRARTPSRSYDAPDRAAGTPRRHHKRSDCIVRTILAERPRRPCRMRFRRRPKRKARNATKVLSKHWAAGLHEAARLRTKSSTTSMRPNLKLVPRHRRRSQIRRAPVFVA